jgi:aspartate/methionine/tyrosine aminotransferase
VNFSRRAQWNAPLNRLTRARDAHRGPLLDLTNSNPTRAGIDYPLDELAELMSRAARAPYSPDPRGLLPAREAIARQLQCDADEIVITASTSESYSFLFKLLCDPGDNVVTATPSYPLLEHLAALESVELRHFPLEFHRRWELDPSRIPIDSRTRAIVVVNPNNPTGSFVTPEEQDALRYLGIPIISDEVFLDYPLAARGSTFAGAFALGGLSKSAGLPHFKLGWIRAPREGVDALELIADNFLSVSTPVQVALPELLPIGARIRERIAERTRASLAAIEETLRERPHARLLPVEGGWSAVIRVPQTSTDEEFALAALERGVVVQPGYFFDFDRDGHFVVSLLTEPSLLQEGLARIV